MELLYPFIISFIMVFIAELGDKTQLLVLSFSGGVKTRNIILGIALGSFFSHGIAILFGSRLGLLDNEYIHNVIKFITYSSFILVGILSLLPKKEKISSYERAERGFPRSTYYTIEQGKSITTNTVNRVCSLLNCKPTTYAALLHNSIKNRKVRFIINQNSFR